MAFCKVCICGNKIVFQNRMGYPDFCPECGRKCSEYETMDENDPLVEYQINMYRSINEEKNEAPAETFGNESSISVEQLRPTQSVKYALRLENGSIIDIPEEGGIIGRTEIGGEQLAEYGSVSRKHLKILIKRTAVLVEDLSTYGTLVNGNRIEKNMPTRVESNSKITLCNVETQLIVKGD